MDYSSYNRLLRAGDSRRLVAGLSVDSSDTRGWTIRVLLFLSLIVWTASGPLSGLTILLAGPLSLIISLRTFSRYRRSKLGPRGTCNMLILSAITGVLTLSGLVLGLLPGIITGTYLMFAPMFIIYRKQGILGAVSSSIKTVHTDFTAYSALWLYTSALIVLGLPVAFGTGSIEEALYMRRMAFLK